MKDSAISTNILTSVILGVFVGSIIIALVLAYGIPDLSGKTTSSNVGIRVSSLVLYSGTASTTSFSQSCSGDSELQLYVSNNSTSSIEISNITLFASSQNRNGTVLIPLSNGCIPISQTHPSIAPQVNDLLVDTYPDISLPLGTECQVIVQFANGQVFAQTLLAQAE